MKLGKIALVGAVLAATVPFAFADTIQLGSFATGAVAPAGDTNTAVNFAGFNATSSTPSSGTGSSFTLNPTTVWAAAVPNSTWVGFAATAGPGGTNGALGYYTFTTTFTALGGNGVYSGTMNLLADDTAEVFLNNSLLIPFGNLGGDAHCADARPGCLVVDSVALSGLHLNSGTNANTLTFVVQQAGGIVAPGLNPTGLDFNATLTATSTPEPSNLLLLGTGMFGAAGGLMSRRRKLAQRTA